MCHGGHVAHPDSSWLPRAYPSVSGGAMSETPSPTVGGGNQAAEESRPVALRCEGIVKWFGGVRSLAGVSLRVHAGEVVALVGDNGAGKSTLVKTLSGIHQPDAGTIWVGDEQVSHLSPPRVREM